MTHLEDHYHQTNPPCELKSVVLGRQNSRKKTEAKEETKPISGDESGAESCSVVAWKRRAGAWETRIVECPQGMVYPESDSDGETIYENSHWATEAEAVDYIQREALATIKLDRRRMNDLEREIEIIKAGICGAANALLLLPNKQL